MDITINPNSNPSHTLFAIYNSTDGYYINANGNNNGDTAVWQTKSDWGTVTVVNLTAGTTYEFQCKAKNGDGIETTFGDSGSGITQSLPNISIKILPQSQTIQVGETTTISIQIEEVTNFGGFEGKLRYKTNIIEITEGDVQTGEFLTSTGQEVIDTGPEFSTSGEDTVFFYGAATYGDQPAPSGTGDFAIIELSGIGVGTTTLDLFDVQVGDADANPILIDVTDSSITVQEPPDTTSPTPNTIASISAPSSTQIDITSTQSQDDTSPIYYQLDGQYYNGASWVDDEGNVNDYAWSTIRPNPFTDDGLVENGWYRYRQKLKDSVSPTPNESNWTTWEEKYTLIEEPTGISFSEVTTSNIELQAQGTLPNLTAGNSGIYFDSNTEGGDVGINLWIQQTSDIVTNLLPNKQYAFKVKARNGDSQETNYSPLASKYTLANKPSAPIISNPTENTLDVDIIPNSNPDYTLFAIYNVTDDYYVAADGTNNGDTSLWQTDSDWGTVTVKGLSADKTYSFQSKAKNGDNIETEFSDVASETTNAFPPTVISAIPNALGQGVSNKNVVITGTNFQKGASVTFTNITLHSTQVDSSTQITVTVSVGTDASTGSGDITVTNSDSKSGTGTGIFTVNSAPMITTLSPSQLPQGSTNQDITIQGDNFQNNASASFSGTGINVNSTTFESATKITANVSIEVTAELGVHDITVTNPDYGVSTQTDAFTVITLLVVDAGEDITICHPNNGGEAQIGGAQTASEGIPPYTYSWTPANSLSDASTANPTATPNTTTTYTVTVTDSSNPQQEVSDTVTIIVSSELIADAGEDKSIENLGDSVQIGGNPTASGGTSPYIYNWTPADTLDNATSSNPNATPTETTTYTVTVTDDNGCEDTDTVQVSIELPPSYTVTIQQGVNIVGLPLDPGEQWTLRELFEFLPVDVMFKYDRENDQFIDYYGDKPTPDYPVRGGECFVALRFGEPLNVTFSGTAWENTMTIQNGVNLVSAPLEPDEPWTLQDLFVKLPVDVMFKYDRENDVFIDYYGNEPTPDYPVRGGLGFVALRFGEATDVIFEGVAWENEEVLAVPSLTASKETPVENAHTGIFIDDDGRVTTADLLNGDRRRRNRKVSLQLNLNDLDINGGDVVPEQTPLLVDKDTNDYLPLFPLSLFRSQQKGQGVFFLNHLDWAAKSEMLKKARYLAYEPLLDQYETRAGELAVNTLEAKIHLMEESVQQRDEEERIRELSREAIVGLRFTDVGDIFKDREDKLAELKRHLNDKKVKFICITGRGGIGKTALVSKICAEIESGELQLSDTTTAMGTDGIIYVSCRSTDKVTVERLYYDISRVLGSPHDEKLKNYWRDTSRSIADKTRFLLSKLQDGCYLLVLDNFEDALASDNTIEEQELRTFFDLCLTTPNTLKLIATSRQRVVIRGQGMRLVRNVSLDKGLPDAESISLLRELDHDGELGLLDTSDKLLQNAVRRCYNVPRALETIAGILSSVPTLNLTQLLDDTALFNEQVVENLITEHYRRITEDQKRVLEALAVYNTPVSADAVSYIMEPFFPNVDVDACLSKLALNYFVTYQRGRDSYELHPLDRDYAYSCIPDEGDDYTKRSLHHRAGKFYLNHAEEIRAGQANNGLKTSSLRRMGWDISVQRQWVESVGQAVEHFFVAEAWQDLTQAHDTVKMFYIAKLDWGYIQECANMCKRMLHAARLADNKSEEAEWLHDWAVMNYHLGNYTMAEQSCLKGLEITRSLEGKEMLSAHFLHRLGRVMEDQGDYKQARDLYEQSVRLKKKVEDFVEVSSTQSRIARLFENEGSLDQALKIVKTSLKLASQENDYYRILEFRCHLVRVLRKLGNYIEAENMCLETMELARQWDNLINLAVSLLEAGHVALSINEYDKAQKFLVESQEIVAFPNDKVKVFHALGMLNHYLSNFTDTCRYYEDALAFDFPLTNYSCTVKLGILCLEEGKKEEARDYFTRGITLCNELLDKTSRLYDVLYHLALAQLGIGQSDDALSTYQRALEVCSAKGVVQSALQDLQLLKRTPQPIAGLDKAIQLFEGVMDGKSG